MAQKLLKGRSLALVSEGRLKRLYAIENAVKASGTLGISLATAIKYVCAGRGALIPCEMCIDAGSWSRDYRKTILVSQAEVDLITALFLAAAEKVYVPEIDFAELQLPHIEHLRYIVKKEEIGNPPARFGAVVEWLQKAIEKTKKGEETMTKYGLGFISDSQFFNHVREMVERLTESMDLKKFSKNIIDPIKMTVEMHAYQISLEEAVAREIARQLGKTVEGAIGWFHQNIFKYVPGWQIPEDGVDVMNDGMTIFAEIKNKHNTMNARSAQSVYDQLKGIVTGNPHATAYLVEVIARESQDVPWTIPGHTLPPLKANRLRRISIDRFYEIVTGDKNAFCKVCSMIGAAVDDVLRDCPTSQFRNTVLAELKLKYPDVVRGLFLSSFSTYSGFENFKIG